MTKVKAKRHLLKAITWRIVATITTIILVLLFTGNLELSLQFGLVEVFVKMLFYYIHERLWYKHSKFGVTNNENET